MMSVAIIIIIHSFCFYRTFYSTKCKIFIKDLFFSVGCGMVEKVSKWQRSGKLSVGRPSIRSSYNLVRVVGTLCRYTDGAGPVCSANLGEGNLAMQQQHSFD